MHKVILLTGGSSGIGAATAKMLADAGHTVYEISRSGTDRGNIRHLTADITKPEQITAAITTVLAEAGHIDVLINNAGCGISGAVEFTSDAEMRRQFDVNLFGTANMTKAVLPVFRSQGSGKIINLSSVAAETPIPFQTWYSASKAAINAYTLALANEVYPFGIQVTAVMPGDIRTGFTNARQKETAGDDVYHGRIQHSVAKMEHDEQHGMQPQKVASLICRLVEKKKLQPLYTVGISYQLLVIAARILPPAVKNFVLKKLYA